MKRIPIISFFFVLNVAFAFGAEVLLEDFEFECDSVDYSGQELVASDGHPLNQFARQMKEKIGGLKLISCPMLLKDKGINGAYLFSKHLLIFPESLMTLQEMDLTTVHELLHAKIWMTLKGKKKTLPSPFTGVAYNDNPSGEMAFNPYGRFFGMDEVLATLYDIYFNKLQAEYVLKGNSDAAQKTQSVLGLMTNDQNNIRENAHHLVVMFKTLSDGLSGESILIDTPVNLDFLTPKRQWQQISFEDVRLIMPKSTNEATLTSMKVFVDETRPKLLKIVELGFLLKSPKNSSKEIKRIADELIVKVDEVLTAFEMRFPKEAAMFDEVTKYFQVDLKTVAPKPQTRAKRRRNS